MVFSQRVFELVENRRASGLRDVPPMRLFAISFLVLIAIGTLGFLVLPGLYTGPRLGFIDALFTATSAVCVTGLIVVDTATYFTTLGQAWIAMLIQLGGLGILTFTTVIIILLGQRATLGIEEAAGGHAFVAKLDRNTLVRAIVVTTLLIELAGAIVLWLGWREQFGWWGAIWPAVFHAISAVCNAGFSVFSDSLTRYQNSPLTLLTIATLIIVGGIGFMVLADLYAVWRKPRTTLSTHSRLVLSTTAVLLVGGTVLFLLFEMNGELTWLSWPDRALNAFFMAVTPRTAGFNTINYDGISNPSLFLTILLMVIGGSPGSTAGGLKTTTFALLALALRARLRGRRYVHVAGRTIPEATIGRAAGLAIGGLMILGISVLLLSILEVPVIEDRTHFIRVVFEAHSAFGTVGLSMGDTTSSLTGLGRIIMVCLMFIGRIGPLAVASAMAIAERRTRADYRYPYEDVVIG